MTVSAYALTSLAGVKSYMSFTTTDANRDALLETLIDQGSAVIEKIIDRQIIARDYVEEKTTTRNVGSIALSQFPVISIIGAWYGEATAINLDGSATGYNAVSVSVNDGTVYLRGVKADGTALTATTIDATPGTYGLTSLLAAKIATDAAGGFTASAAVTVPGVRLWNQSADATGAATLTYADTAMDFIPKPYGLQVAVNAFADWNIDPVWNNSAQRRVYNRRVKVWYKAGFVTAPAALTSICNELVSFNYNQAGQNTAVASESMPEYSSSINTTTGFSVPDYLAKRLKQWASIPVA
jgi:hypothetical protein